MGKKHNTDTRIIRTNYFHVHVLDQLQNLMVDNKNIQDIYVCVIIYSVMVQTDTRKDIYK